MSPSFLLYGSYGYTGRLIAREAINRGLRPLLGGRNADELARQAAQLQLPFRAFSLDDPQLLDDVLAGVPLVLNAAGPFSRTALPMAEACIRTGTHYLDITGEIEVFEALAAVGPRAEAAGTMLLPGAGFDVVPSDCLAAHLAGRLPRATHLALAFQTLGGGISRGTATTMIENLDKGGAVRRNGQIVAVPAAFQTREVDFGRGAVAVTTIPWGDVATAFHSTGIPNIEVYTRMPAGLRRAMIATRHLGWALGSGPVQKVLERVVARRPAGPDADQRSRGRSEFWGAVADAAGNTTVARLRTPEGYTLTALASVTAAERVLAGEATPGYQTPSLAFGADFVFELPGVQREDEV